MPRVSNPPELCTIDGCTRRYRARGWCATHYRRWQMHGDPLAIVRNFTRGRVCAVEDCDRPVDARQWCEMHYARWQRTGDPAGTNWQRPPAERFFAFVDWVRPGGCWFWIGTVNNEGYGQFWDGERKVYAHRWAYERFYGVSIPAGMELLHRCDIPCCVTPFHLFAGTHTDNMRDMVAKGRHWRQREKGGVNA